MLPHATGPLTLRISTGHGAEIEAVGSSFVYFPSVRDAEGELRAAEPLDACAPLRSEPQAPGGADEPRDDGGGDETEWHGANARRGGDESEWEGAMILARRGNCTFHQKARNAQIAGAAGLVVIDTEEGPVAGFTMSGARASGMPRAAPPPRQPRATPKYGVLESLALCRVRAVPAAPAGPEPHESGIVIPVAIVPKDEGHELLQLGRRPCARAVRARLGGFEREVLTVRHSHGLALELLPASFSARQRRASWYPGHNYRHSNCRVCNAHVGYYFNRTLAAPHQGAGHAGAEEAERAGGSAQAPLRSFHALLRDAVADSGGLRGMTARMRLAPVL